MRGLHPRIRLAIASTVLALCAAALCLPGAPLAVRASSTTASVWLQTMDSCEQALDGASYQVIGDNGLDLRVSTPGSGKQSVVSGNCPVQHGDCSSTTTGCVHITGLPPGSYRIHETATPPGNSSNPEGYAACNGGSACQRQETDITVSSSGSASGTTTNVYPDGTVATYPSGSSWPGTASDPIVVHNFGLASPGSQGAECDGDGDADDHSTGSPSTHCQYPESEESSACKPFPWSCTLGPWTPPTTTTTTTTTSTSTDTTSSTTTTTSTDTTSTTTATAGCGITAGTTGKLKKGKKKSYAFTSAATGGAGIDLTWNGGGSVRVQVLDSTSTVLAQTTGSGGSLHLDAGGLAAGKYKVSLKLSGAKSAPFTLAVAHC